MLENGCVNQGVDTTDFDLSKPELETKKPDETAGALNQICDILKQFQDRQEKQVDDDGCRTNWMLVAMVVDRFLLLVFILLTVVVSCAILMNRPKYSYDVVTEPLD